MPIDFQEDQAIDFQEDQPVAPAVPIEEPPRTVEERAARDFYSLQRTFGPISRRPVIAPPARLGDYTLEGPGLIPNVQPPPEAGTVEKVAAGLYNLGVSIPNFIASPEGVMTMAAPQLLPVRVAAPIIKGAFMGLGAKAAGEAAGEAAVTKDPQTITEAAGAAAFVPLIGLSPMERINARRVQTPTEIHGNVRPPPGEGLPQVPIQEGGEGIRPQPTPTAPAPEAVDAAQRQTRLLLSPAIENNRSLGLGHEVEIQENFGTDDPQNRHVFRAVPGSFDAQGKFVPGRIRVNRAALDLWLNEDMRGLTEAEKAKAIQAGLAEEGIHSIVTPEEALAYRKTLSAPEIMAGEKLYRGPFSAAEKPLSAETSGHELLRQRMQRLARMEPTEVAEAVGREKWTRASIEMISRIIRRIREFFGTEAAKRGTQITDTLLNRMEQNANAAMEAIERGNVPEAEPVAAGAEEPFQIRRGGKARDETGTFVAELFRPESRQSNRDTANLGMKIDSIADLEALAEARRNAIAQSRELLSNAMKLPVGDPERMRLTTQAMLLGQKAQYPREVIETATKTGSWATDHPNLGVQGDRPMDYQKHPEVADWLRKNGRQLSIVLPEELRGPEQPASMRRKEAKTAEFYLPPATGEARPGTEVAPYEPVSMPRLQAAATEHFTKNPRPNFDDFTAEVRARYGDIRPAQLRDLWQDAVWNRLMSAPGAELGRLAKALGLSRALKIETQAGLKYIPDAPQPELTAQQPAKPAPTTYKGKQYQLLPEEPTKPSPRAQFTPTQRIRASVIAAIGNKLIGESQGGVKAAARREIDPEELATPNPTIQRQPVYQSLTSADAANVDSLGRVLTDDARAFGGAKLTTLEGGKKVSITQKGLPVTVTKRLSAIQNKVTGKVSLVSTYRHGRTGAMLLDPEAPGRHHSPLSSILNRFRVIASVLLEDPVKDFQQDFRDLAEYENDFGMPARARAERGFGYEAPPEEIEPPIARWQVEQPVTGDEAGKIVDAIHGEVGLFQGPDDVKAALPTFEGEALSGAIKLAAEISRKNPAMTGPEVVDALAKNLYENYRRAKTIKEFQQITMGQGVAPGAKEIAPGPPAGIARPTLPSRLAASPRDIILRRRVPIQAGVIEPPLQPKPTEPPATPTLTPEESAYVGRMAAAKYPPMPKVLYRQLAHREVQKNPYRIGGSKSAERIAAEAEPKREPVEPVDPALPEEPASIRRIRQAVQDELEAVGYSAKMLTKRGTTSQLIAAKRDAADTIANNLARQAETSVRIESVHRPTGFVQQRVLPWRLGNPRMLAAANAIVEAGAVDTATGTVNVGKVLHALPFFRADVELGLTKAEQLANSNHWWERRLAQAWIRNQKALLQELDDCRDMILDPELQNTATRIHQINEAQANLEISKGYEISKDPNYLAHRYDAHLWGKGFVGALRQRVLGRRFRSPRAFDTYYSASAMGPYIAATRDGASLTGHRVRQGMHMLLRDDWMEGLKTIKTPEGQPVAIEPKAVGAKRWNSPHRDYEIVMAGGKALAVHKDFAGLINGFVGRNPVQDWALTRGALHLSQILKHTLLVGDFFHLGRVLYYASSIMGLRRAPGWGKKGWSVLDIADRDMNEAVRRGLISQKDVDWSREQIPFGRQQTISRRQLVNEFQKAGFNVGKIQDALYKDLITNLTPSAGPIRRGIHYVVDPTVGRYNRFLFDRLTRGLMTESAVREFERQAKARPDIDPRRLVADISRDVNNYFGNIGRQGFLKPAWVQDLARIFWLAPQWVEGLLRKEFTFATRVTAGVGRRGLEMAGVRMTTPRAGLTPLGTVGKGLGQGLLFMIGLTQAINLITRRQPTWKNEEKGHKFDAWIPGWGEDSEGFWFSPMAVFNEITHDIYRISETKPLMWDAVNQVAGNKESPLFRAGMIAASGYGPNFAQYLPTTGSRVKAIGEALLPVPITFGRYATAAGHALAPTMIRPNPPGAVQRQLFATGGIKVEPASSDLQQIQQLAREFAQSRGHMEAFHLQATDVPGYSKLRQAVRNNDAEGAWKVLAELRKQGKSDKDILKQMDQWSKRNFTWSKDAEAEFQMEIQQDHPGLYSDAMLKKLQEYQKFIEIYQAEPR